MGEACKANKDQKGYYSATIITPKQLSLWFGQRCLTGLILNNMLYIHRAHKALSIITTNVL